MNKIILLFTGIFLFLFSETFAQPFEIVNTSIQDVGRSALAWGDYDNDGDLDLVICGLNNADTHITEIYENNNGTFIVTEAELFGVKDGSVAWGDFDNDNDLDILLSGVTEESGNICMIYRNDNGSFAEYDAGLPGVGYGDASWGDFDNDGDLDIIVMGDWVVSLYENVEGSYLLTENDFGHLQNTKSCWGDFDNDGDLDILLVGDTGGGYLSDVYLNDDGIYTAANLEMEGVISGTADMVDFDNDGDLDLAITGFNIFLDPCFYIYENLGEGTIALYFTFMEGIATSTVDWGDYDNDGDLDILMAGKNAACSSSLAKVYNNDNGTFTMENGATMDGALRCNAAWADYDNDGDLDYILSGLTLSDYPFTILYRNEAGSNEFVANTLPEPPSGLETFVDGQSVTLSWQKATDIETPQDGLCYNIRLGVHMGENEMISPLSDNESGYRLVQAIGNTNMQTSWTISNLAAGTYYWSVQSIDQAYCGSEFAEEGSFMITATGVNEFEGSIISNIFPNPAIDRIYLYSDDHNEFKINILNPVGQLVHSAFVTSGEAVDISFLKEGIYFVQAVEGNSVSVHRIVKQ